MSDFWNPLVMATTLAIRDYYRDKEKAKQKQQNFYQKCLEEISDYSSQLCSIVTDIATKTSGNYISQEIGEGILNLPMYAFRLVLKAQGIRPTPEQMRTLDLYFDNLSLKYSKFDFLNMSGSAGKYIDELMGVSHAYIGSFWKALIKTICVGNINFDAISKISDGFANIVMRFAVLGNPNSNVALPICESFIQGLQCHIEQIVTEPPKQDNIDYLGELTFNEHRKRAEFAAKTLYQLANDDTLPEYDDMISFYFLALEYELANSVYNTRYELAQTLDYLYAITGINTQGMNGEAMLLDFDTTSNLNFYKTIVASFMNILMILGDKTEHQDLAMEFIRESCNFMIGLENQLAKKYSKYSVKRFASEYMSNKIDEVLNTYNGG